MTKNLDPTRTTVLRKNFETAMKARFNAVKREVQKWVGKIDIFGLGKSDPLSPFITNVASRPAYQFLTDAQKTQQFQKDLKELVDLEILSPVDGLSNQPWTSQFIDSAYRKGAVRAYIDTKRTTTPGNFPFDGTSKEFLENSFLQPERLSKVELLATRAFEELKGVTAAMSQQMNRIVSRGIADGIGPRKLAKELADNVEGITRKRALVIARTEIIHAHAEGQLDSFEDLGVEEVGVMAEWSTAGDDRVCPQCSAIEGEVLTVQEARNLIPRHPNCRCAWIPYIDDPKKNRKKKLKEAIKESIKRERPKRPFKEAKALSTWPGKNLKFPTKFRKIREAAKKAAEEAAKKAAAEVAKKKAERAAVRAAKRKAAELKGKKDAISKSKVEAKRKAAEARAAKAAKIKAEKEARRAAEKAAKARRAAEEAEKRAAEARAKAAEKQRQKEARAAARKAKKEAERKAKEEARKAAKEAAKRKAEEEAAKKAREKAERKAQKAKEAAAKKEAEKARKAAAKKEAAAKKAREKAEKEAAKKEAAAKAEVAKKPLSPLELQFEQYKKSLEPRTWEETSYKDLKKVWKKKFNSDLKLDKFVVGNDFRNARITEVMNGIGKEYARIWTEFPRLRSGLSLDEMRMYGSIIPKFPNAAGLYKRDKFHHSISMRTLNKGIPISPKAGASRTGGWTVGTDIPSTFRHELGHHIHVNNTEMLKTWKEIYDGKSTDWWKDNVSRYGSSNHFEAFAESFAAYTDPTGAGRADLPKVLRDYFAKNIEGDIVP